MDPTVAACQMAVADLDVERNLGEIIDRVGGLPEQVDVACFPEMALTGFVSDELIAFYEPMAAAGTPLIVTGNMFVSPDGQSTPRQIGADDDDKISVLERLTEAVHGHGSTIVAQLSHCGRQVVPPYVGRDEAV
jgi:2,4-dienoyl-CoA reductase-like NADH-dependent reductase (Old Yellow Enzyme family)